MPLLNGIAIGTSYKANNNVNFSKIQVILI